MKKNIITRKNINEQAKAEILNATEFVCLYEDGNQTEQWAGLSTNSTETIKCLIWNEGYPEDCVLIDYGVTRAELCRDTRFLVACLNDGDVNHAIKDETDPDTGKEVSVLSELEIKQIFAWHLGESDCIPVTPCGLENFIASYL